MNKCIRISFAAHGLPNGFLREAILKRARALNLEGTAQINTTEQHVKIVACGTKESIDAFLDFLHKGPDKTILENIEADPFLKDKDYRGVFRVIE